MKTPSLRYLCSAVCLVALCVVGFRCGTLAQDCLEDTDCSALHRCVSLQCLLVAQEFEPSEKIAEDGGSSDEVAPEGESEKIAETELCEEGKTRSCYDGPAETLGKGACVAGTQRCQGGAWGACEGQSLPKLSRCDGGDHDCDGLPDRCGLGAWCDGLSCEAGLSCHQGRCMTPCDPRMGVRSNPTCDAEGTQFACFALSESGGICKRLCSSRKSSPYDDPNCALGTYCVDKTGDYEPGICTPTTPPARGTRLLGQVCSTVSVSENCNGDLGFVCALSGTTQRCFQACDPHQPSSCGANRLCKGTHLSFLGGICQD